MAENARIAYILKGFPRLSETFIANEIYLLEMLGLRLELFSVKRGETDKVHNVVKRIRSPLHYLPQTPSVSGHTLLSWLVRHAGQFLPAHAQLLKRRPGAYAKTLASALAMAWRYRAKRFGFRKSIIKEFLQAGHIAAHVAATDDIQHLHGHFCHGATTITWFVSQLTGLPFSFTAHAKDIYQEQLNPGELLQRKLAAAQFITTCTHANYEYLKQLCLQSHKIHAIYHGLDTQSFAPLSASAFKTDTAHTPLILSVGRFVAKKGFLDLIDACAKLKTQGYRFRCLIVGERGDQYGLVRQRIEHLGLQNTVELQNAITQDELKTVYAQTTVFALPCQILADGDRDGIPNVLVEAMAMGIPVVSTPISGIPELVENGVNGLLTPQRDSQALALAIAKLLDDSALRSQLGCAARAKVCREFDAWETTKKLRDLFLASLNEKPIADFNTVPKQHSGVAV